VKASVKTNLGAEQTGRQQRGGGGGKENEEPVIRKKNAENMGHCPTLHMEQRGAKVKIVGIQYGQSPGGPDRRLETSNHFWTEKDGRPQRTAGEEGEPDFARRRKDPCVDRGWSISRLQRVKVDERP